MRARSPPTLYVWKIENHPAGRKKAPGHEVVAVAKALVITEKPSVSRDIAAALGSFAEHDGYWESDSHVLTFAVGHLFELLEPEEIDPRYKRWTLDVLPILPERFELKKKKGQSERVKLIEKLAGRDDVDRLVNACDAGREGELIFREIVRFLGIEKPVTRLWLQSMTTDAIRNGFANLLPGRQFEGLAQAAECRAYSDWLIGMNATRVLTKRLKSRKEKTAWSAGRVQTPTLALLVGRELEVLAHVPRPFWRVTAVIQHPSHSYTATWFDPGFREGDDEEQRDDRIFDVARAQAIVAAVSGQAGAASESRKPSRESAPPLFDLTSLQREANRRFGWSARRALGAAQRCYEAHKLLTYPRTDSRCLPSDYRATVDTVLQRLSQGRGEDLGDYAAGASRLLESGLQNAGRIFDDAGVSDHFAIMPTGQLPHAGVRGDDRRVYDLVTRRFLGAFHPPALWERVERTTETAGESFRTRARALMEPGWRSVLPGADEEDSAPIAPLQVGANEVSGVGVRTDTVAADAEETKPLPRISEGRLLSLMENAGQNVEDEDIAAVLHERGLGTPATRADIIENLIAKGYALRVGKALRPTVKGIRLIDTLNRIQEVRLASAALTGEIEQHLRQVEHGERTAAEFMREMREYASEIVERGRGFAYEELYANEEPLGPCPACGKPVIEMAWFYRCQPQEGVEKEADCPLRFWKDIGGRYLDRVSAKQLVQQGRSPILDGFTARSGRTYRGTLELDTDEWRVRIHAEAWNEEAASETPEYEVNSEPLGACPLSEDCEVQEMPTQFACTTRQRADEQQAAYRSARKAAREQSLPVPEKPEKPDHPGLVLPRTVCKREITREEALHYLKNGRTELLTDFTSRHGRPFSAILVLKDTGRHGFEFLPRGKAAEAGAEPAATAAPTVAPPRAPRRRKPSPLTKRVVERPLKVAKAGTKKQPQRKRAVKRAGKRRKAAASKAEAE